MKTESIMPALGMFTFGLFVGILLFVAILLPSYQRVVNKQHYADEVIQECLNQCPELYDSIVTKDCWAIYSYYNLELYNH